MIVAVLMVILLLQEELRLRELSRISQSEWIEMRGTTYQDSMR